ncbi:MAG: UDP-N-acetylmuramoyl-L-alanyl-D-glutamate--2,6-diaminopimelate ligase [Spirochaetota bacterium]|nr:MAG: UDP-N-acetylmuramoyl-L-alanyl-D-glutamate--2,6-diaminopimelate ligase [Spirochaetota bacterium]
MRLKEIIEKTGCCTYSGSLDPEIRQLCSDSREVKKGALFVAVEGYNESGQKYIKDALKNGASAIVVEEKFKNRVKVGRDVPVCYTPNARKCVLFLARVFFRFPSEGLVLIGITGTNGKTTITYLLEEILKEDGKNCGVIGTVSYRYNDVVKKANNTTPDPIAIQSLLNNMKSEGVSHLIIEVSSHALVMDRVYPPDFDVAVFTNLSQDHLDFHGTMDEYFIAKSILFRELGKDATSVVNSDDKYGRMLIPMISGKVLSYGIKCDAEIKGKCNSLTMEGTDFTINGINFKTHLIGIHNLYNILSAYSVIKVLGIEDETFHRSLTKLKVIPGRLEKVGGLRNYHTFVDYAHTPDALENLLDAIKSIKRGRVITVFGCGGDRDRRKRPLMGRVVEERSDIAIVTSDNPRTEEPDAIIEDIRKGLNKKNHIIIPDRRSAIYKAVELAGKDDVVLIAGKGHEDYQVLKDKTIHFDDREVVLEAMESLKK